MTLSVIIPVYRVEATLDRCVESVLRQHVDDMEVILVDDGSPDRCPEMCDNWAIKDQRIHVIHKQNGGLSDARNAQQHATIPSPLQSPLGSGSKIPSKGKTPVCQAPTVYWAVHDFRHNNTMS